jgi:hypothetical protein
VLAAGDELSLFGTLSLGDGAPLAVLLAVPL